MLWEQLDSQERDVPSEAYDLGTPDLWVALGERNQPFPWELVWETGAGSRGRDPQQASLLGGMKDRQLEVGGMYVLRADMGPMGSLSLGESRIRA